MFDRCCEESKTTRYSLEHSPKPYSYSEDIEKAIKTFFLYMPNIDSAQSLEIELLNEQLYDDFIFSYLLKLMDMDEDRDVKWYEKDDSIDAGEWDFYRNNLCTSCQKIIICRIAKHTKIKNLFRCLRNCIAHGDFYVYDEDILIGFNTHKASGKAIIKIKPQKLLNAVNTIVDVRHSGLIKENIFAYAFEQIGYSVEKNTNNICDLILSKDNFEYLVEIKQYKGEKYIGFDQISMLACRANELEDNQVYVLIIDTSRLYKKAEKDIAIIPKFKVVDINRIKELLGGVDIINQ